MINNDFELTAYTINDGGKLTIEELEKAHKAVSHLCRPADRTMIIQAIAKLHELTACKASGDGDLHLKFSAYADNLAEYPADAVVDVLNKAPTRSKWWPTWFELQTELDYLTRHRRLMLEAIDRKIAKIQPSSIAGMIEGAIKRG